MTDPSGMHRSTALTNETIFHFGHQYTFLAKNGGYASNDCSFEIYWSFRITIDELAEELIFGLFNFFD